MMNVYSQIVFTLEDDRRTYAIDEVNQRAYSPRRACMYGTYWKYGGNQFNSFRAHWWPNLTTFEIKNYMGFRYPMIHSTNSSTIN